MANSNIRKIQSIHFVDVTTPSNGVLRVDTATTEVGITNYIGAIVLDSNNYAVVPYTYSNLLYVSVKTRDNMANAAGTFKVRIFYFK